VYVPVRLTQAEADTLDQNRRSLTRSAYIRLKMGLATSAWPDKTPERTVSQPTPHQPEGPQPTVGTKTHLHKMVDTGRVRRDRGMVSRERACQDADCDEVRWT
jgi:hypothetical protein